jgi:hypothetical protein
MWRTRKLGLVGAIASLSTVSAAAEPVRLAGEAIQATVSGAIVELDTPLGTKIPVQFSRNGLMAGQAGSLAGFLGAARDRGRWWVDGDLLCMKWFRWFEAETHCMSLRQDGSQIYWQEQSGRSGTARIAGKIEEKPVAPTYITASASVDLPTAAPAPQQAAAPSATKPAQAETREVQPTERLRAPPPASDPTPSPAPTVVKQAASTVEAQRASAQVNQLQMKARADDVSNAAPPPPARPVTRRLASSSDVRVPTFSVTRVAQDDVLNVRAGPSQYHQRVGALPPNGSGISIIGPCRGLWCPIRYGRLKGWVNSYYLAAEIPSASAIASR